MGFFSDLKEDLSQAVNELMPEEGMEGAVAEKEAAAPVVEAKAEMSLNDMLERVDSIKVPEEMDIVKASEPETDLVKEREPELVREREPEVSPRLERMLDNVLNETPVPEKTITERMPEINAGRTAADETAVITAGMTITGDVMSEGSLEIIGCVNGNIELFGKLNITGYVNGNSHAAEIFADSAKINGEVVSDGAVKIGSSSVIIGNITATSAVIAGAVKGDIDVRGPVILDTSAIVMGNIKSKSVQINNGAVIEGMCSQCYADVNPTNFFDDYKPEAKKGKSRR